MTTFDPAFLRRVAASIRETNYGHKTKSLAEAEADLIDAMADKLEARERLATDIGRVAIEASEGVAYGSEPDDFFRAAGGAVFAWLSLNGFRVIGAEELEDMRIMLGLNGSQDITVVLDAQLRLRALFPAAEPADEPATCRDPECGGCNAAEHPAPGETGPWPSLSDVPTEVRKVIDANGDEWLRRSDIEWFGCAEGGITGVCRAGHPNLAPFNTVSIEAKWQTWQKVPEGVKSVRDRTGQCWRYYPFIGWTCDFPGHRTRPMNDFAPFITADGGAS